MCFPNHNQPIYFRTSWVGDVKGWAHTHSLTLAHTHPHTLAVRLCCTPCVFSSPSSPPPFHPPPTPKQVSDPAPVLRYDGPYCTRACMCMFRACLGQPTGREGRAGSDPPSKALHVMTCMTHYHWPQPALSICAQHGLGGGPKMVVVAGSPGSVLALQGCFICPACLFFFHLPSCLSCSCHTLVRLVATDSCGSPARLDFFPRHSFFFFWLGGGPGRGGGGRM